MCIRHRRCTDNVGLVANYIAVLNRWAILQLIIVCADVALPVSQSIVGNVTT